MVDVNSEDPPKKLFFVIRFSILHYILLVFQVRKKFSTELMIRRLKYFEIHMKLKHVLLCEVEIKVQVRNWQHSLFIIHKPTVNLLLAYLYYTHKTKNFQKQRANALSNSISVSSLLIMNTLFIFEGSLTVTKI